MADRSGSGQYPPGDVENPSIPTRPLDHVLLVAGVRGAGKTAFLLQLADRRLPKVISANLPPHAARWPQLEEDHHSTWLPHLSEPGKFPERRLALHVDLIHFGDPEYRAGLVTVALSRNVTVVTIKPSLDRLTVQFSARESRLAAALASNKPVPEEFYRQIATDAPGRRDIGAANPGAQTVDQARRFLLSQYAKPQWLAGIYADWDAHIRELAQGAALRMIEVAPDPAQAKGRDHGWQLLAEEYPTPQGGDPRRS